MRPSWLPELGRVASLAGVLLVCGAGGYLFTLLGIPASWLAGSMVAMLGLLAGGARVDVPPLLRETVFILLGIQIGAAVTWDTVSEMAKWPVSLLLLALTVTTIVVSGISFFRRLHGWDNATAFFAAVPGALSLVLAVATRSSADMAQVTVVQAIRLGFLIAVLPLLITAMGPAAGAHLVVLHEGQPLDTLLAIASGVAGGALFHWLNIPTGWMLGAALPNAVLHLAGVTEGTLPNALLIPAYVVLGTIIGDRFQDTSGDKILAALWAGFGGFLLSLAISAVGALAASAAADVPLADALVAFAPGGLEAMVVLAFALGLDPAYVGGHQIARYLGLSIALPLVSGPLLRHWLKSRSPD